MIRITELQILSTIYAAICTIYYIWKISKGLDDGLTEKEILNIVLTFIPSVLLIFWIIVSFNNGFT